MRDALARLHRALNANLPDAESIREAIDRVDDGTLNYLESLIPFGDDGMSVRPQHLRQLIDAYRERDALRAKLARLDEIDALKAEMARLTTTRCCVTDPPKSEGWYMLMDDKGPCLIAQYRSDISEWHSVWGRTYGPEDLDRWRWQPIAAKETIWTGRDTVRVEDVTGSARPDIDAAMLAAAKEMCAGK